MSPDVSETGRLLADVGGTNARFAWQADAGLLGVWSIAGHSPAGVSHHPAHLEDHLWQSMSPSGHSADGFLF